MISLITALYTHRIFYTLRCLRPLNKCLSWSRYCHGPSSRLHLYIASIYFIYLYYSSQPHFFLESSGLLLPLSICFCSLFSPLCTLSVFFLLYSLVCPFSYFVHPGNLITPASEFHLTLVLFISSPIFSGSIKPICSFPISLLSVFLIFSWLFYRLNCLLLT